MWGLPSLSRAIDVSSITLTVSSISSPCRSAVIPKFLVGEIMIGEIRNCSVSFVLSFALKFLGLTLSLIGLTLNFLGLTLKFLVLFDAYAEGMSNTSITVKVKKWIKCLFTDVSVCFFSVFISTSLWFICCSCIQVIAMPMPIHINVC